MRIQGLKAKCEVVMEKRAKFQKFKGNGDGKAKDKKIRGR